MTGRNEDYDIGLILDELGKIGWVSKKELLTLGMPNATLGRRLNVLLKESKNKPAKIKRELRGWEAYFALNSTTEIKVEEEPSQVDAFLLEECKRLASDIIASGVLQHSMEELGEVSAKAMEHNPVLEDDLNKELMANFPAMTPEILEENRKRRELRYHLLKRCASLYEALRLVKMRREYKMPKLSESLSMTEEWDESRRPWKQPSPGLGMSLNIWLEFILNSADALSRELEKSEKHRG